MTKHERIATIAYLCRQLSGDEISETGDIIYIDNPYIHRIVANAQIALLTQCGHLSAVGINALKSVAPNIHVTDIEKDLDNHVVYGRINFPTPRGRRSLVFINK